MPIDWTCLKAKRKKLTVCNVNQCLSCKPNTLINMMTLV